MPETRPSSPSNRRASARTAVVRAALDRAVDALVAATGRPELEVVDVGGGTGGFAVPLATRGHRVVVVEPSLDALAALERRAAEAGATDRVRAVQGDVRDLPDLVPLGAADLVLCHGVLEHSEDPSAAVRTLATVLAPAGTASLLLPQRLAAVLARALAGRFDEARHALTDPAGRWGDNDPVPHRFEATDLPALLAGSGLVVREVHGVRVFADLVPGALVDSEPGAADALLALEDAVSSHPVLAGIAARLHVLAVRQP